MIFTMGSITIKQVKAAGFGEKDEMQKKNAPYSYNPDLKKELRNSSHSKVVVLNPKDIKESLEGEYAFVPRYSKGKTKVTVVRGDKSEVYTKSAITVTSEGAKEGRKIIFEDVGFYKGRQIDLVEEIISVSKEATFGLGGDNSGLLYTSFLGISATGSSNQDRAEVRYSFKYHDTQEPAKITGYLTFIDIDREEAMDLFDSNIEHVYVLNTSEVVGDMVDDNRLHLQSPKRSYWWDDDWNVKASDMTRWVSVTFKDTDSLNIAVTTTTTAIDESTIGYASQLLLPLNYPAPNKIAINTDENKDQRKIQYSIISQIPAKVVPVPEPRYKIKDTLPPQFKVDDVTCIDRESGEKKDFDVSIEGSTLIIDGKKFLDDPKFYNHLYEFIVTGSYAEGKLNHFETVPGENNYVNIPNIADLIVSNVDETDRILKTNEAKAPVRLIAGDVTVKYLEESSKQPIVDDIVLKGELDQEYQTEAKEVGEYTLKTTPTNAKGTFQKQDQEVQYLYVKNQPEARITKTSLLNKTYEASNHSDSELIETAMKDEIDLTNQLTLKKNASEQYELKQKIVIPLHSSIKKIQFKGKSLSDDTWSEKKLDEWKQVEIDIPVEATADPEKLETTLVITFEMEEGYSDGEVVPIPKEKNNIQVKEAIEKSNSFNSVSIEMTTNSLLFKATTLDYGENDVSTKETILNRKNQSAILTFEDTRRQPSNLTLSVKSSTFKDSKNTPLGAELYYYDDETNNQGVTSLDTLVPILTTADKFPNELNWKLKQGLRLLVPAGAALVGNYTSELVWTLADVPEN